MTEDGIKIRLLDSKEKNVSFVLEMIKNSSYGIAGLTIYQNKERVTSMLVSKEILSIGRQNGSDEERFGVAVPYLIDEPNEFGLYGIIFDKKMISERPESMALAILGLKDHLFRQRMTKLGVLLPRSVEMAEVMAKLRRQGFKQEAIWRAFFKTSAGFIDGVLLDATDNDRKTIICDEASALSDLVPDKKIVQEALDLVPWLGLTEKQKILIETVLQNPGKMHLDLASIGRIDRAYVSELCWLLSERGFIMQIDDEKDCRMKHVYPIAEMIIKQAKEFKNAVPQKKPTEEEIWRLKVLFVERSKALGLSFRNPLIGKLNTAIESLANHFGEIVTIAKLAKDLNCSDQSTRDVMRILVKADMVKTSFKGINGKATKVLQLKLEERTKEVIEPEPEIEEKICETHTKEIAAPAGIKIEKIIVSAEDHVAPILEAEPASKQIEDPISSVCLEYGFCDIQKIILDGLNNVPDKALKTTEIRKLNGLEQITSEKFNGCLIDLREQKAIEIQNNLIILKQLEAGK